MSLDFLSRPQMKHHLSKVRSRDTRPEMLIRQHLWRRGYRYRKNLSSLPGKPDIVFPRAKLVIFVHGCFWHRHGCHRTYTPKTNTEYWNNKFSRNMTRDAEVLERLRRLGWQTHVIWECELSICPQNCLSQLEKVIDLAMKSNIC